MFPTNANLGRLGNSIAWWLGIEPYELFLYVFLPPLLLDAAVRIDFFLFKRVCPQLGNDLLQCEMLRFPCSPC